MKSFKQYISEQEEHAEMPLYRLSGKPHLPYIEVYDSKGGVHQAPFHSELKDGQIRYDFTEAGQNAKKSGAAFLRIGYEKPGVKELSFHHGRDFRMDVFDKSPKGMGLQIMTYTPEGRGDDEPPAPAPEPRLKKARRLGTPMRVGGGRAPRRTSRLVKK